MRVRILGECMKFHSDVVRNKLWGDDRQNRCPSCQPSAVHVASSNHVCNWSWLHTGNKRCNVNEQEWFCFCFAVEVMWLSWWEWDHLLSIRLMRMIQWVYDQFMMRIKPSMQEHISLMAFLSYLSLFFYSQHYLFSVWVSSFFSLSYSLLWLVVLIFWLELTVLMSLVTAGQKIKSKARLCRDGECV